MGHNILAYNLAVNWIWVAFAMSFFTFHPRYTQLSWIDIEKPVVFYAFVFLYAMTELMSLLTTMHLQNVYEYKQAHPKGDPRFFIPTQHGFSKITCANYFWRLCAFALISLMSNTLIGLIYLVFKYI